MTSAATASLVTGALLQSSAGLGVAPGDRDAQWPSAGASESTSPSGRPSPLKGPLQSPARAPNVHTSHGVTTVALELRRFPRERGVSFLVTAGLLVAY